MPFCILLSLELCHIQFPSVVKERPLEEMLEILELNPLSSEELWCEQHEVFLLYMNTPMHDAL